MDPGSIAGLAATVLGVAGQIHGFISSVKDAKEEIRRLSLELLALKGALDHFEACAKNNDRPSSSKPDVSGMVKMTHDIVVSIEKQLGQEPKSRLGKAITSLTWHLKKVDVDRYCMALERSKTWFIMVIMQDSNDSTKAVYSEMQRLMEVIHEDIIARSHARKAAMTDMTLRWLAPVSNEDEHIKASRGRIPGTGVWFKDEAFENWWAMAPKSKPILWYTGKSGSGKTIMASSIIDEMKRRCQPEKEGVSFHYCSLDNSASQQSSNVLGALLAQLARLKPEVVDMLQPLRTPTSGLVPCTSLSMSELEDLIVFGLSLFDKYCAVIDALNETPDQDHILTSLLNICGRCKNFRVITTCTSPYAGESDLVARKNMVTDVVDRDIETYVIYRLAHEDGFKRVTSETRDLISTTIKGGAHGTFRWAQLCMDRLSTLRTGRDIRNALNDMPSTLNETYVNILCRVSDADRQMAREALIWLCFSVFPLTDIQLAEAAVLDESDHYLDDDCRLSDPAAIVDICRDLVEIDHAKMITLAHDSIRSFLTGEYIKSSAASYFALSADSAHRTIMRKCITYLSFDEFATGRESDYQAYRFRARRWPLCGYAAIYWPIHANQFTFSASDEELILAMFATKTNPRGGVFESWVQMLLDSSDIDTIRATEPLYYAASYNMVPILKLLLRPGSGVNTNKKGGRYRSSPLTIACFRANREAAMMLLEAGADPRARDGGTGMSAFSLAKRRMMDDVVEKFEEVLKGGAATFFGKDEVRW